MPIPTSLSFLGVAKETTKGTFVPATDYIPIAAPQPSDDIMMLEDLALRGSMARLYNLIPGPSSSSFDLPTSPVFNDSIGYLLGCLFGDVTTTGAGAPFTHAFAVKNSTNGQPLSYSWTDFDGLTVTTGTRGWPGIQVYEIGFKFNSEGYLTHDTKSYGFPSASATKPTAAFSAITPIPVWKCTPTIGGGAILTLLDGDFTITRTAKILHTADGTQPPYAVFVGEMTVTGTLNFVAEDETELLRYLNNTQPSLDLAFVQDASNKVTLHCSKAAYKTGKADRSDIFAKVGVSFEAIANATDAGASGGVSPCKVTILNAKPASTFV